MVLIVKEKKKNVYVWLFVMHLLCVLESRSTRRIAVQQTYNEAQCTREVLQFSPYEVCWRISTTFSKSINQQEYSRYETTYFRVYI
jgi:hypothetical protein